MSLQITRETEQQLFFHNYNRLPLAVTHGEGHYLFTSDGSRYLDMISGIGVSALGYGDRRIIEAIVRQSEKIIHASNLFMLEPQFRLAEKLLDISGLSKVFLANSGTEAVEAALKLSRKWASRSGKQEKREIVSLSNCFHGRTYGAMSLTDKPKYLDGYEPLLPGTTNVAFNDPDDLAKKVNGNTAAVIVEFVQGEGGVHRISDEFVNALNELRDQHGFLVVADEIQAGCGRTGTFFSYMQFDIQPDLVCLAKPLGGGLPLSAVIGSSKVEEVFSAGSHGTTFGGNPVACAAGLALIETIYDDNLMERTVETGEHIRKGLENMAARYPQIQEIRQYGLMIGTTVKRDASYYVQEALKKKVLVNATSGNVVRLLPPLTITNDEAQICLDCLDEIFSEEKES